MDSTDHVSPAAAKGIPRPLWQPAIPATFNAFKGEAALYLMIHELDAFVAFSRAISGAVLPKTNHHGSNAAELNAAARALIERRQRAVYAILASAVSPEDRAQIQPLPEANQIDPIGVDPDKFWDACILHSRGAVAAMCGSDLHDQIEAWRWPTVGDDAHPLTMVDQVRTAITQLRNFHAQAVVIADSDYPFTTALAVKKFVSALPARFNPERKAYRRIKTLAALQTEAASDAKEFDAEPSTGTDAMFARNVEDMPTLIKALAAMLQSDRPRRGNTGLNPNRGARTRFTRERLLDQAAGPPQPGFLFCSHHGWTSSHDDSRCFVLHPETDPRRK